MSECGLLINFFSAFNIFAQFTCRVWHPSEKEHYAWSSTNLETFAVDENAKTDFIADKVKLSLAEDLSTYTFTVSVNPKTIIDVTPSPADTIFLNLIIGTIQTGWSGAQNRRFILKLWRRSN
jgi:hypothetical protein